MSEAQFQTKVIAFLKSLPNTYYVKVHGSSFQAAGTPDILACVNGLFVAIELKAPRGRASPLQIRALEKIMQAGGTSVLLYPDGFDKFKQDMLEYSQIKE